MPATTVNPREIRLKLGMNQQEFWGRIGVTQSGGSRYESGRAMPKPVQELLRVVHVERIDLAQIGKDDVAVLRYLKQHRPELYTLLLEAASAEPASNDAARPAAH
ncbi:Transcriptional regulator, contains XRE-family HTH domain [Andreprevotia lacus DSM 23236]|jgi:transcriptional regulator with XRE-family HTH domain|uniref:Transcriptional regulator, contains XRE-family HTH domain n=1 Tax=Andreprevotia lacus DSM 23236 TaxID=1121001 RepID=A0A1W1XXA8_9NEIS|nr:helix-turn-helix transcriptional regulator [Andreprevotia lacus]SMC28181.1 Transcriptional regulator, contains XRE-family HTH domain [Andreprevotia lacus DSM 23236]